MVRKSGDTRHTSQLTFHLQNATYYDCFIECLSQAGEIIPEKDPLETSDDEISGSYKKILTTPAVHLLAFFILFYVGAEVTIGGMVLAVVITTFLQCGLLMVSFSFSDLRVGRDVHHPR